MHDIDRTMFESGEIGELEFGELELGEVGELETMLASELLEITNEQELDRFIGNLFSTVTGAARRFAGSDTGRALGGILKQAAGKALPVIGRGVAGAINPAYADLGARVGASASSLFGLELEGLSMEDREFEAARAFVRFAADATRQAASAPPGSPPGAVASQAAASAAARFAPGLSPVAHRPVGRYRGRTSRSGRWVRRGNTITLFGL
jgi:hypothetical protein